MGRRVDRAALAALCAGGYYVFLLNAWGSIPLACAGAFLCVALTGRVLRDLPGRRRAGRAQARAELNRLAALEDGAASEALGRLIRGRWPGEDFALAVALKHPEAGLSSGDVLNAWKANRAAPRLVIAATCPCEPRAAAYARTLREPAVAVVDSRGILRLLRRLPADALPPVPHAPMKLRLRRAAVRAASGRVTPGDVLLCAALLALYLFAGNAPALPAALALAARIALAARGGRIGKRLFDRSGESL